LLHPVVPVNSLDNLDFTETLTSEIQNALKEVKYKLTETKDKISSNIRKHKEGLRNHIIFIRDALRTEFDDFFNNLLSSIR